MKVIQGGNGNNDKNDGENRNGIGNRGSGNDNNNNQCFNQAKFLIKENFTTTTSTVSTTKLILI